ncbi:MAG: ATP-binding protein [Rhodocyclaceae bacterium]|nr:ATP-binding protein [Rhodocyclaceae bacterium]
MQSDHWFHEPNPLIANLPVFASMADLAARLAFHPTAGLNLATLTDFERIELLTGDKMPLEPTEQSIRVAAKCLGMLRGSLKVRNPIRAESRRRYWDFIKTDQITKAPLMPSPVSGVSALIIKGPTGTGKTVTIQRLCNLLPQVIHHGPCPEAQWLQMSQLVYLYTNLPSDGTRGGFLLQILLDLDRALGTDYAGTLFRKFKTVERLAIATVVRLVAHYTGIIFIDEGQLRNLMKSDQAELMQLFLLTLINTGIPVVLMGNELAFDWINYSQDLSRLNTVPAEYHHPIGAIDSEYADDDWSAFRRGVFGFYVLTEPVREPERCSDVLRECCGGVQRSGLVLWSESQLEAIFAGASSIGPEDILKVYAGGSFEKLRPLADGFAKRDPKRLLLFPDVNAAFYARAWGKALDDESESSGGNAGGAKPESKARTEQSKFKAEKTREAKKQEKREALDKTLSPEDIRKRGTQDLHVAGLEKLQEELERGSGDGSE